MLIFCRSIPLVNLITFCLIVIFGFVLYDGYSIPIISSILLIAAAFIFQVKTTSNSVLPK